VIGNCQAPTIADVISRIVADASVETFLLRLAPRGRDELAAKLSEFDVVFAQPAEYEKAGPLAFRELQKRHGCVVPYPAVLFHGFHPDFILGREIGDVRSAALTYHSLIVAAAYSSGIPTNNVGRLFNPLTFAQLGYYKEYGKSRAFLLSKAKELGYDLSDDFRGWESGGVFMHTPNHPAVRVLVSIAARAAQKAGLPVTPDLTEGMDDRLARAVRLPVYPAIAKRLKVAPNAKFRLQNPQGVRRFDLHEYISTTYEMYRSASPAFFEVPSIRRVAAVLSELA
jgi:hypothetical protein